MSAKPKEPIRGIYDKMGVFPPIICRLLARTGGKGFASRSLTDEEIAASSGLPVSEVKGIAWQTSWDSLTTSQMKAFTEACGIRFDDRRSMQLHMRLLAGDNPFRYARRSTQWPEFKDMLLVLRKEQGGGR